MPDVAVFDVHGEHRLGTGEVTAEPSRAGPPRAVELAARTTRRSPAVITAGRWAGCPGRRRNGTGPDRHHPPPGSPWRSPARGLDSPSTAPRVPEVPATSLLGPLLRTPHDCRDKLQGRRQPAPPPALS